MQGGTIKKRNKGGAMKHYQIRYIVQESEDGVLWHDLMDCMSEEEAVDEVIMLQDTELRRVS
jgi:hypothetical protein